MTDVSDMNGRFVDVGDRIAAAFRYRPFSGTVAELRIGTVVAIIKRRDTFHGGRKEPVDALRVEWDYSSQETVLQDYLVKKYQEDCERAGRRLDPPKFLYREYKKKTSDIMVSHKRFIKLD